MYVINYKPNGMNTSHKLKILQWPAVIYIDFSKTFDKRYVQQFEIEIDKSYYICCS